MSKRATRKLVFCYGIILGRKGVVVITQGKKHHVDFSAHKKVKEPTEVKFKTKTGELVDFEARKPVEKRIDVSFMARNKKK